MGESNGGEIYWTCPGFFVRFLCVRFGEAGTLAPERHID